VAACPIVAEAGAAGRGPRLYSLCAVPLPGYSGLRSILENSPDTLPLRRAAAVNVSLAATQAGVLGFLSGVQFTGSSGVESNFAAGTVDRLHNPTNTVGTCPTVADTPVLGFLSGMPSVWSATAGSTSDVLASDVLSLLPVVGSAWLSILAWTAFGPVVSAIDFVMTLDLSRTMSLTVMPFVRICNTSLKMSVFLTTLGWLLVGVDGAPGPGDDSVGPDIGEATVAFFVMFLSKAAMEIKRRSVITDSLTGDDVVDKTPQPRADVRASANVFTAILPRENTQSLGRSAWPSISIDNGNAEDRRHHVRPENHLTNLTHLDADCGESTDMGEEVGNLGRDVIDLMILTGVDYQDAVSLLWTHGDVADAVLAVDENRPSDTHATTRSNFTGLDSCHSIPCIHDLVKACDRCSSKKCLRALSAAEGGGTECIGCQPRSTQGIIGANPGIACEQIHTSDLPGINGSAISDNRARRLHTPWGDKHWCSRRRAQELHDARSTRAAIQCKNYFACPGFDDISPPDMYATAIGQLPRENCGSAGLYNIIVEDTAVSWSSQSSDSWSNQSHGVGASSLNVSSDGSKLVTESEKSVGTDCGFMHSVIGSEISDAGDTVLCEYGSAVPLAEIPKCDTQVSSSELAEDWLATQEYIQSHNSAASVCDVMDLDDTGLSVSRDALTVTLIQPLKSMKNSTDARCQEPAFCAIVKELIAPEYVPHDEGTYQIFVIGANGPNMEGMGGNGEGDDGIEGGDGGGRKHTLDSSKKHKKTLKATKTDAPDEDNTIQQSMRQLPRFTRAVGNEALHIMRTHKKEREDRQERERLETLDLATAAFFDGVDVGREDAEDEAMDIFVWENIFNQRRADAEAMAEQFADERRTRLREDAAVREGETSRLTQLSISIRELQSVADTAQRQFVLNQNAIMAVDENARHVLGAQPQSIPQIQEGILSIQTDVEELEAADISELSQSVKNDGLDSLNEFLLAHRNIILIATYARRHSILYAGMSALLERTHNSVRVRESNSNAMTDLEVRAAQIETDKLLQTLPRRSAVSEGILGNIRKIVDLLCTTKVGRIDTAHRDAMWVGSAPANNDHDQYPWVSRPTQGQNRAPLTIQAAAHARFALEGDPSMWRLFPLDGTGVETNEKITLDSQATSDEHANSPRSSHVAHGTYATCTPYWVGRFTGASSTARRDGPLQPDAAMFVTAEQSSNTDTQRHPRQSNFVTVARHDCFHARRIHYPEKRHLASPKKGPHTVTVTRFDSECNAISGGRCVFERRNAARSSAGRSQCPGKRSITSS